MPASEPLPVVIACPHCGTRYQIPYAAIGAKGRSVLCAQCGQSWEAHAPAPPKPALVAVDTPLDALAEEVLDQQFAAEARRQTAKREARRQAREAASTKAKPQPEGIDPTGGESFDAGARAAAIAQVAAATDPAAEGARPSRSPEHQRTLDEIRAAVGAPAGDADPAARLRREEAFSRRQRLLQRRLPMARMRRMARLGALLTLALVVGCGLLLRQPIVAAFPALAAPYAAIGLPVNAVGLEFRNVQTLEALQQGVELLTVKGDIASVAGHEVAVPPVLVTLLNPAGKPLYQWSMTAKAGELEPGEHIGFSTQLSQPPEGAHDVRLSFASDRLPAPSPTPEGAAGTAGGDDGTITFAKTAGEPESGRNPHR